MALTFDTYQPPTKRYTMITASVDDDDDALLIRRPFNLIGQGKWQFGHTPAGTDPGFTLEAGFGTLINATPGWLGITTTGHEIPEMASAIRIRSGDGKFGGQFSCIVDGNVSTYATTQSTTFNVTSSVAISLAVHSASNPLRQTMSIDPPGNFMDHVVTIVSSDPTKATVTDISRGESTVSYAVTPLAAGSTTLTFTLTPLATGTALTAVTRTVTVVA